MNHAVLHIVFHVYGRLVLGHRIGVCELGLPKFVCSALVLGRGVVVGRLGAAKAQNKLFRACKVVFQHCRQLSGAASPQNGNQRPCRAASGRKPAK